MSAIDNFESNLKSQLTPELREELSREELDSIIQSLENEAISTFANAPELIVETFHNVFNELSNIDGVTTEEQALLQSSLSYIRCIELHCVLKKLMGDAFTDRLYSVEALSDRSSAVNISVNDLVSVTDIKERGVYTKLELLREIDECRQLGFVSLSISADTPAKYAQALLFQTYFSDLSIDSSAAISTPEQQNLFASEFINLASVIVSFGRQVQVPDSLPDSCKHLIAFANNGVDFEYNSETKKFSVIIPEDSLHILRNNSSIDIAPLDALRGRSNLVSNRSIENLLSPVLIRILNLSNNHPLSKDFLDTNLHKFRLSEEDQLDLNQEQFNQLLSEQLNAVNFRFRSTTFINNIRFLLSKFLATPQDLVSRFEAKIYRANRLFLKRFYKAHGFNCSYNQESSMLIITPIENHYLQIQTERNLELNLQQAFTLATQPITNLARELGGELNPIERYTLQPVTSGGTASRASASGASRGSDSSAPRGSDSGASRGSDTSSIRNRSVQNLTASNTESGDATVEQPTAEQRTAEQRTVEQRTAERSTPVQSTPVPSTAERSTPVQSTPVQSTPVQSTPVQSTPVQSTPVQSTPVQSTPVQSTPVQSTPVQSTPTAEPVNGDSEVRGVTDEGLVGPPASQSTHPVQPATVTPQPPARGETSIGETPDGQETLAAETPIQPPTETESEQTDQTNPRTPQTQPQTQAQTPTSTSTRGGTPTPAPTPTRGGTPTTPSAQETSTQPTDPPTPSAQETQKAPPAPRELPQAESQSISEGLPVSPIEISRFRRRLKVPSERRKYTDRLSLNLLNHQQATEINSGETSSNTPNQYDLQRVAYYHPRSTALTARTFQQTMSERNLQGRFYGLHNGQMLIRDNSGAFSLRTLDSNGPMTVNSEHITAVTTQTEGLPANWQAFSNFLERGYSLKSRGSGSTLQFQLSSPDSQVKSNWFRWTSQSKIPFRSVYSLNPSQDLLGMTLFIETSPNDPDLLVFESLSSGVYLAREARGNSLFAVVASDETDYLLTTARFNYENKFGAWFRTNRSALRSLYPAMQTDDPIEYLKVAYRDRDQVGSYLTTLDLVGREYFAVSESSEVSDPSIVIEQFQMDSIRESSNIYSSVSVPTTEQFRSLGLERSLNPAQLFGQIWRSFSPSPFYIVGKLFQNPSQLSDGMRNLITKLILIDLFNADKYPESVRTKLTDIQQKYNVLTRSISTVNPTEARLELFMQDPNVLFARFNRTQRLYYLEVMQFLLQNSDFDFQHGISTRSFISVMPCFGMIQSEFRSIQLSDTINSEFRINPGQKNALDQSTLFTVNDSSITQFNGQDLASPIQIPDGAKIILEQPTRSSSNFNLKLLRSDGSQIDSYQLRYNPNSGTLINQAYTREYHRVMQSVNSSFTQEPVELFVIDGQAKVLNSRVISNLSILTTAYSSVESMPELSAQAQIYVESSTLSASVYINEAKIIDGDNTYVIKFETSQELPVSSSPDVTRPTFYAQTENTSLHSFGTLPQVVLKNFIRNLDGGTPYIQQKLPTEVVPAHILITRELNQQLGLQRSRSVIDVQAFYNFVVEKDLKFLFDTEFIQLKKVGDSVMFRYMPFGDFLEFTDENITAVNRSISDQARQKFNLLSASLDTAREAHARSVQQSQEPVSILTENNDIDAKVSTLNNRLRGLGVTETVTYNQTTKFFEFKNKRYLNLFLFDSNNCIKLNDQIISNSPPDESFTSFQVNQLRYNPDNLVAGAPYETSAVSDTFSTRDAFIAEIRRYKKETLTWNGQSLICNPEGKEYLENIPEALRGLLNIEGQFVVRNNRRRIDDTTFILPSITDENIFSISGLEGIRILPSHAQSLKAAGMLDADSNLGLGMADFQALLGANIGTVMYAYFNENSLQVNQIPFNFFPLNLSTRLEEFRSKLPPAYIDTLSRPFPVMIDSQESLVSQSAQVEARNYFTLRGDRSQRRSGVSVHSSGAFSTLGFKNVSLSEGVSQTVMPDGFTFGLFRGYLHTKSTAETPSPLSSLVTQLSPYGLVVGEYFFPRINQSTRSPREPEYHTPPIKMSLSDVYSIDTDGKFKLNGREVCTLHNKDELNIAATHVLAESLRNRFTTNNQFTSASEGSNTVFNGEFRLVLPANLQVRKYSAEAPDLDLRQSVTVVENTGVEDEYLVTQNDTQYRIKFND